MRRGTGVGGEGEGGGLLRGVMNEKIFIIDFRGNTNLISSVLRNIKVNIIFLKCLIEQGNRTKISIKICFVA